MSYSIYNTISHSIYQLFQSLATRYSNRRPSG